MSEDRQKNLYLFTGEIIYGMSLYLLKLSLRLNKYPFFLCSGVWNNPGFRSEAVWRRTLW